MRKSQLLALTRRMSGVRIARRPLATVQLTDQADEATVADDERRVRSSQGPGMDASVALAQAALEEFWL